jgi:osmotically-inducible protein OsmY
MKKGAFWIGMVLASGMLLAQQPMPMGKMSDSAKNYRSVDGTVLSKHSSDDDLARALNESYANDPEFSNVQVTVKHHRVTLAGTVVTKDAKQRAEKTAVNMAGVRDVRDRLKVGVDNPRRPETEVSTAH